MQRDRAKFEKRQNRSFVTSLCGSGHFWMFCELVAAAIRRRDAQPTMA
jgi:hypothetical protein